MKSKLLCLYGEEYEEDCNRLTDDTKVQFCQAAKQIYSKYKCHVRSWDRYVYFVYILKIYIWTRLIGYRCVESHPIRLLYCVHCCHAECERKAFGKVAPSVAQEDDCTFMSTVLNRSILKGLHWTAEVPQLTKYCRFAGSLIDGSSHLPIRFVINFISRVFPYLEIPDTTH